MKNKIRVAVLYGGRSGEHDVSLISAKNVIENLDRDQFEVVPIGIDKQGAWYLGDDILMKELSAPSKMLRLQREKSRLLFNPDMLGKPLQTFTQQNTLPQTIAQTQLLSQKNKLFDVIFPAIHGTFCEDGTIQGLFECADIPYVGCGVMASALGMDKDISKRLIQNAGIAVAKFITIKRGEWDKNSDSWCKTISDNLPYPLFVKPANTGSSVGVEKVKENKNLFSTIQNAFQYDAKVIVEEGIDAIEIELAVLEAAEYGDDPIVSMPGEVRPSHEFYSYAAKYLDEHGAELIIPAPLSEQLKKQTQHIAKNIFNLLDCEGMARVDLFLDKKSEKIYFNEINTIPGFTQISMYPKLMAASGISYSELLSRLIHLAIKRHERRSHLKRESENLL